MATTVSPAIANSIGLASEYLPLLDEVYKAESTRYRPGHGSLV